MKFLLISITFLLSCSQKENRIQADAIIKQDNAELSMAQEPKVFENDTLFGIWQSDKPIKNGEKGHLYIDDNTTLKYDHPFFSTDKDLVGRLYYYCCSSQSEPFMYYVFTTESGYKVYSLDVVFAEDKVKIIEEIGINLLEDKLKFTRSSKIYEFSYLKNEKLSNPMLDLMTLIE